MIERICAEILGDAGMSTRYSLGGTPACERTGLPEVRRASILPHYWRGVNEVSERTGFRFVAGLYPTGVSPRCHEGSGEGIFNARARRRSAAEPQTKDAGSNECRKRTALRNLYTPVFRTNPQVKDHEDGRLLRVGTARQGSRAEGAERAFYQMVFAGYCENAMSRVTIVRPSVSACAINNRSNGSR
jgi:hypothetical protein